MRDQVPASGSTRWRPIRRLLRAMPLVGLALGAALLLAWHFLWLPRVHVGDPRWMAGHSDEEMCAEIAKVVRTWGWNHDMSLAAGSCGPEWVDTILESVRPGDELDSCSEGHLGTALRMLTGQGIGEQDLDGWKRWHAENRGKSQATWHRDAFAKAGIVVPARLAHEDAYTLLAWLGSRHDPDGPPISSAYRLLRNEDVMDAIRVHGPTRPLTPSEAIGLQRFTLWEARNGPWESDMIATPPYRQLLRLGAWILATVSAFALGFQAARRRPRRPLESG